MNVGSAQDREGDNMSNIPNPEQEADKREARAGVNRAPLPERRPAELGTFLAGLTGSLAYLGLDVSTDVLLGFFVVLTLLPSIISFLVTQYRESIYGNYDE